MISLSLSKSVMSHLTGNGTEHGYRFIRWLDLLEMDVADLNPAKVNTIRITHTALSSSNLITNLKRSNSSASADIPAIAKEIGSPMFLLQFVGYDANKSRTSFLKAIHEMQRAAAKKLNVEESDFPRTVTTNVQEP